MKNLNIPSVGQEKYNPKNESIVLKAAITNYFKKTGMTTKEIKNYFEIIEKDPYIQDEKSITYFCKIWMPGKKLETIRLRNIASLLEYVKCLRKLFF